MKSERVKQIVIHPVFFGWSFYSSKWERLTSAFQPKTWQSPILRYTTVWIINCNSLPLRAKNSGPRLKYYNNWPKRRSYRWLLQESVRSTVYTAWFIASLNKNSQIPSFDFVRVVVRTLFGSLPDSDSSAGSSILGRQFNAPFNIITRRTYFAAIANRGIADKNSAIYLTRTLFGSMWMSRCYINSRSLMFAAVSQLTCLRSHHLPHKLNTWWRWFIINLTEFHPWVSFVKVSKGFSFEGRLMDNYQIVDKLSPRLI